MVALSPAFQAEGLAVRLGRTPVLRGVDLRAPAGEVYGLLGRNGAGKTTTLRCLLGYLPHFSGSAKVFGTDSRRLHAVKTPLGVALDPPGLDDTLTVLENLHLARLRGGIQGGRGPEECLRLVGMAHRARHRGGRLSHGQGRRAAVARALLGAPQLLVLDEPLSGLDPEGVEGLLALFQRLAREEGVTVILSSHHLREVEEICDRVGILDEGRVVAEGPLAELLSAVGGRVEVGFRRSKVTLAELESQTQLAVQPSSDSNRFLLQTLPETDLVQLCKRLATSDLGLNLFQPQRPSLVDFFRQTTQSREETS